MRHADQRPEAALLKWAGVCLTVAIVALWLLLVTGCGTTGGARWYAPATWWSSRPAANVDKAHAQESNARDAVIKAAQKATHETQIALASAPASRPVAVASDSNNSAVALLDQAAGPLDAADLARIRQTIVGLLSDNAALRAAAEKDRAREQGNIAEVSAALSRAEAKSTAAEDKLRTAFDRENALANELRSQRALLWIAGSLAVVLGAAYIYAQFALGGLPGALAAAKRAIERDHPDVAAKIAPYYSAALDNRHKRAIKSASS